MTKRELIADLVDGSPGDVYDPPSVGEPTCDTCRIPESRWPVDHPLHVLGSGQCAWCRQADIEDDKRYGRLLDQ